jgi:hypothetical protein
MPAFPEVSRALPPSVPPLDEPDDAGSHFKFKLLRSGGVFSELVLALLLGPLALRGLVGAGPVYLRLLRTGGEK